MGIFLHCHSEEGGIEEIFNEAKGVFGEDADFQRSDDLSLSQI